MFPWQRIIAGLLILVFAPASVLAATPFKLCFGVDGHRAIESVVVPHHHGHPIFSGWAAEPAKHSVSKAVNADCYDVGVLDGAQGLTRAVGNPIQAKKFKSHSDTLILFPQILRAVSECDSVRARHAEDGVIERDPHLASLATIVLLN